tara:strand:+ start:455 stop:658 length:204 start_codon:yes stop_codon:yes gene_type:complete
MKLVKIKDENLIFSDGTKLWILDYEVLNSMGKAPKLSISDSFKVGDAMKKYGYNDDAFFNAREGGDK